jgi:hypothetical protein
LPTSGQNNWCIKLLIDFIVILYYFTILKLIQCCDENLSRAYEFYLNSI